jgi:hypothetical protein
VEAGGLRPIARQHCATEIGRIKVISVYPKDTFAETVRDIFDRAAPAVVCGRTCNGCFLGDG